MEARYITNLVGLKPSNFNEFSLEIGKIYNPRTFDLLHIMGLDFIKSFGMQGLNEIQNNNCIAYHSLTLNDNETTNQISIVNEFKDFANSILMFTDFLWLVKDNAVYFRTIYSNTKDIDNSVKTAIYYSTAIYSRSDSSFNDIDFTENELIHAVTLMNKFCQLCPDYKKSHSEFYYRGTNRIEKSFAFIRTARKIQLLHAKIAMYMSALECLFSTDSGELLFKVSTRTAFYVGVDKEDRKYIQSNISDAYDIRSKYLHGGELKRNKLKNAEYQISLAIKIDEILRKVIRKAIAQDSDTFAPKEKESEKFDLFLKDLIFI
jgi:hypothetical protein